MTTEINIVKEPITRWYHYTYNHTLTLCGKRLHHSWPRYTSNLRSVQENLICGSCKKELWMDAT